MYFLGIEIGGTKLQFAIAAEDADNLIYQEKHFIETSLGAEGILKQISGILPTLLKTYPIQHVGIGFGGPVDRKKAVVIKSHQVDGWDHFPIVEWFNQQFNLSASVANDCDLAALAEAKLGAGKDCSTVFYVTVGTGIGGGLVINGKLYLGSANAAAEIGHLRPSITATSNAATVESIASGPGIVATVIDLLQNDETEKKTFFQLCEATEQSLTCQHVVAAAEQGSSVARQAISKATHTLGWAIAQMITLLAPDRIVIGGGVSMMPAELFFDPLSSEIQQFVFPPLGDTYELHQAELGEAVVLYGALLLAIEHSVD